MITPLQAAALLLLVRLSLFFCDSAPFTSAYALSTAAVSWCGAAAAMLFVTMKFHFPRIAMKILRICAIFGGAYILWRCFILLTFLHMPHLVLSAIFVLLAVIYACRQPFAAAARTGVLLLILAAAGFLLLPVSGIGTAHALHLFLPAALPAAILQELRSSADFLLLPLLLEKVRGERQRAVLWWGIGRGIVLPLIVLFGTMQNGRLRAWQGSAFFLLLARTPLSDAVRTDGFWMLLAVASAAVAASAMLKQSKFANAYGGSS